jgi:hypothetical protein
MAGRTDRVLPPWTKAIVVAFSSLSSRERARVRGIKPDLFFENWLFIPFDCAQDRLRRAQDEEGGPAYGFRQSAPPAGSGGAKARLTRCCSRRSM